MHIFDKTMQDATTVQRQSLPYLLSNAHLKFLSAQLILLTGKGVADHMSANSKNHIRWYINEESNAMTR